MIKIDLKILIKYKTSEMINNINKLKKLLELKTIYGSF